MRGSGSIMNKLNLFLCMKLQQLRKKLHGNCLKEGKNELEM